MQEHAIGIILLCLIARCYGAKMKTSPATPSADITILVDKIAAFLSTQSQVFLTLLVPRGVGRGRSVPPFRKLRRRPPYGPKCALILFKNYSKFWQVKEWIRLSTTVGAAKPVLALKSTLFERAGVPSFPHDLKASKYFAEQRANTR
jgi:hypothetical protein